MDDAPADDVNDPAERRPSVSSRTPRLEAQAVRSLSRQATRPDEICTGLGNSPTFCSRQAVVRLIPYNSLTRGHGSRRSGARGVSNSSRDPTTSLQHQVGAIAEDSG